MKMIKCIEGHYEVQEVELGRVYRWCPECVVVECCCGERLILTRSEATCDKCGAEHRAIVREELAARRSEEDEVSRPWRSWRSSGDTGIPF